MSKVAPSASGYMMVKRILVPPLAGEAVPRYRHGRLALDALQDLPGFVQRALRAFDQQDHSAFTAADAAGRHQTRVHPGQDAQSLDLSDHQSAGDRHQPDLLA